MSLNADELADYQSLKRALCSGSQLAHPDLSKHFVVHTDASKLAIGAVLLQRSDNKIERLIFYFSKTNCCPSSKTTRRVSENASPSSLPSLISASNCSRGRLSCVLTTRRLHGCSRRNPMPVRALVVGSRRCSNTRSSSST